MKNPVLLLIAALFNILCLSAQKQAVIKPAGLQQIATSGTSRPLAKNSSRYAIDYEDYIPYNVFTHSHDTFTRTYYTYDSSGRVSHDSILAYHLSKKSFADSLVDDYTYDTAGRVIALIHKGVNGKTLYVKGVDSTIYDAHDLAVGHLSYELNNGVWQMTYGVKQLYTYNSANLPTQAIAIGYDVPGSTWIPISRTDAIYSKYNKPFANVDYRYIGSKWVMEDSLLVSRYYHNTIAPDSTYIYVAFSSFTNKWEQYFKETIFYSSLAKVVSRRRLVKNSTGQWVPAIKDTMVYNKDGITLLDADSLACGLNCYKLSSIYKDSLFYDADGNIARYDINYKFLNDSTFTLGYRYVYHYKKIVITSLPETFAGDQLIIYPNPASDVLKIKYTANANAEPLLIKIYDMQGRLKYENSYSNSSTIGIPVSDLAAGIYSVQLLDGGNVMNRLIVKE